MNVLIAGCSISNPQASNFDDDYLDEHYTQRIGLKNNNVINLSVGGQSNQKILLKTCAEISKQQIKYDLVIVQWTSLFRLNLNKCFSIYENCCNITISGVSNQPKEVQKFWSIWCKNFIHPRIEILEWFSQIILLENFLKNKNIPYVFVKGFDNFLNDIHKENWQLTSDEFKLAVLRHDYHPDLEISHIYDEMLSLYNIIDKNHWLNLPAEAWDDDVIDKSEDNRHPGPKSHNLYYNSLENYIKKLGLYF